jgi:hypothetical protein
MQQGGGCAQAAGPAVVLLTLAVLRRRARRFA